MTLNNNQLRVVVVSGDTDPKCPLSLRKQEGTTLELHCDGFKAITRKAVLQGLHDEQQSTATITGALYEYNGRYYVDEPFFYSVSQTHERIVEKYKHQLPWLTQLEVFDDISADFLDLTAEPQNLDNFCETGKGTLELAMVLREEAEKLTPAEHRLMHDTAFDLEVLAAFLLYGIF